MYVKGYTIGVSLYMTKNSSYWVKAANNCQAYSRLLLSSQKKNCTYVTYHDHTFRLRCHYTICKWRWHHREEGKKFPSHRFDSRCKQKKWKWYFVFPILIKNETKMSKLLEKQMFFLPIVRNRIFCKW